MAKRKYTSAVIHSGVYSNSDGDQFIHATLEGDKRLHVTLDPIGWIINIETNNRVKLPKYAIKLIHDALRDYPFTDFRIYEYTQDGSTRYAPHLRYYDPARFHERVIRWIKVLFQRSGQ